MTAQNTTKGAKGNPARIRMANVSKKTKRINNKARNERIKLATGFSSLTALRNWCHAHKRDTNPTNQRDAQRLMRVWG